LILLSNCAHKGAPGGGKEDKTLPAVIAVTPAPDSLFVPGNKKIVFTFSEWISRQSIDKFIFISPTVPPMKISASGRKIRIAPKGRLMDSTTYVITLGTDIKDLHNNSLASAYTLSFSTGSFIDSGFIDGMIYDKKGNKMVQGYSVFAYLKGDTLAIDPMTRIPDYITQVGNDGSFQLQNLKFGDFRIFAISDLNRNKKFNPGRERIGVPHEDITLSPENPEFTGLILVPAAMDTALLSLKQVKSRPGGKLIVSFSKPVKDSLVLNPANYTITTEDTALDKGDTLEIVSIIPFPDDSLTHLFLVSIPKNSVKYILKAGNLVALDNTLLDTARNTYKFLGNGLGDSIAPEISKSVPRNRRRNISIFDTVKLVLSEPIQEDKFKAGFSFLKKIIHIDTTDSVVKRDTTIVPLSGRQYFLSPLEFIFCPDSLEYDAQYEWQLDPKKFIDKSNNFSPDSAIAGSFFTIKENIYGIISGKVELADPSPCRVAVFSKKDKKAGELSPDKAGRYAIQRLPEGVYKVLAYIDANRNRVFDRGALRPFIFAEKFVVADDSVYVRPRWEVEDLNISFAPKPKAAAEPDSLKND
jgi:uncharacterized protein (DUF2141 family)